MAASNENLCCYHIEGESFVESNVLDKTWVYEFTSEQKKKLHDSETPSFTNYEKKNSKLSYTQKKMIVKDSCCVTFSHQKQHLTVINRETLREAIERKRPGRLTTGVRLLHDGARPHTSAQTAAWLQKRKWAVL
jgi:hypothetical protein